MVWHGIDTELIKGGVVMGKHYRCIRFNLYDIHRDTKIAQLVDEIKMSFCSRAKCEISTEDYKRSQNNMFVIVEVIGNKESIDEAIKETQYIFSKKCKESDHQNWFA